MPIRVAIVEDDPGVRDSLGLLLDHATGFRCVSRYPSGEEALEGISKDRPDVVLMDINLPKMSGIECVSRLKSADPQLQILMLTVYEDSDQIFQSLVAGASGYLLKRTPRLKLLEAIEEVFRGGSPMTSHIARKVVQYFQQRRPASPELEGLTAREVEVLGHLSTGALYKEIADALGVSLDTVRLHIKRIYEKLHVHSRTEAVAKYLGK